MNTREENIYTIIVIIAVYKRITWVQQILNNIIVDF